MTSLTEIQSRAIRYAVMKRLLAFLVRNSPSPTATGKRAEMLEWLVNGGGRRQRALAKRLDVSEARASAAIKFLRAEMVTLQGD